MKYKIPAVPLKLHGNAIPLFRLQQALGTDAASSEIPTCKKRWGISARKGWDALAAVCRASTAPGSLRNALPDPSSSSLFIDCCMNHITCSEKCQPAIHLPARRFLILHPATSGHSGHSALRSAGCAIHPDRASPWERLPGGKPCHFQFRSCRSYGRPGLWDSGP